MGYRCDWLEGETWAVMKWGNGTLLRRWSDWQADCGRLSNHLPSCRDFSAGLSQMHLTLWTFSSGFHVKLSNHDHSGLSVWHKCAVISSCDNGTSFFFLKKGCIFFWGWHVFSSTKKAIMEAPVHGWSLCFSKRHINGWWRRQPVFRTDGGTEPQLSVHRLRRYWARSSHHLTLGCTDRLLHLSCSVLTTLPTHTVASSRSSTRVPGHCGKLHFL